MVEGSSLPGGAWEVGWGRVGKAVMVLMRKRRANAVVAAVQELRLSIVLSLCKIVWKRFFWNDLERFDVRKACNVLSIGAVGKYSEREREKRVRERREGGYLYVLSEEEKNKY